MANTRISDLTASASNLASTDLAPVVQTAGVGPVKMTGLQLAGGLLGSATFNGATVTTSQPVLNLSQTWNAAGVQFTGILFTATNTASDQFSRLIDLKVGANTVFQVSRFPNMTVASGGTNFFDVSTSALSLAAATSIQWANSTNASGTTDTFLRRAAAATLQLGAADTSASATVTITIATPGVVTWSSHGLSTGTPVIFSTTGALPTGITAGTTYYVIVVDANSFQIATSYANATAVSPTAVNTSGSQSGTHTGTRGAVDQVFRVQSASGTSNFPGADFAIQGSRGTGTGAGGSIIFQVAPAGSSGTAQNAYASVWQITGNGHLTCPTDNTYDIGASGANRPRNVYVAGAILSASLTATGNVIAGASATLSWSGTSAIYTPSYGVIALSNWSGTDFDRLQFGGTTSSFPALKRSTTTLQVRLADDSAFAQLTASSLLAAGSTGVVGYSTGAGGAVTQATSRTTGVTLNKGCGQITLVSAAGTTSWQSFTVSNTTVAATDTIIVNQDSGTDLYQIFVTNVAANSFQITFATTGGTTTEQPVFSFAVIKAVTS